jgi:hypothetical protein
MIIKTFEKYTSDDFKSYIIWKSKKIFMILSVIQVTEYHLKFKKLYIYSNGKLEKIRNEKIDIFHNYDQIKRHIVYESDNLQDCIDMLSDIDIAIKYNL